MRLRFTFIFLSIFLMNGLGQGHFTINEFLGAAKYEEMVAYQKKKLNFLTEISHELPLIEKLEFRTATNDFIFREQEYLLRVSPNSPRTIKAQSKYQETQRDITNKEIATELNQAIKERYDLLIKYIYSGKQLEIYKKQKVLLSDKVLLLERSISLQGFEILDLIEAQDKEQETIREILNFENVILTIGTEMEMRMNNQKTLKIDFNKLLSISELRERLKNIETTNPITSNKLKLLSAKSHNSKYEYEYELSKTKFSLGYIQAKYGYAPNDNFAKTFSIGLGFEIPLKGASKLDLKDLEVKAFELESQYQDLKNYLAEQKITLRQRLNYLLQQYDLIQQQLNDSQAEYALKEYSKIAGASPIALLKMRENTLKKEMILQKLEFGIMQTFIDYLDISGQLSNFPLKNYLLKNFERL